MNPAAEPCCATTPVIGVDLGGLDDLAKRYKALGDATRLRLLALIAASNGGEACVCDLQEPVGLTQGTVSHHMKILVEAGFVEREQRGKWAYYRLVHGALPDLMADFQRSVPAPSRTMA